MSRQQPRHKIPPSLPPQREGQRELEERAPKSRRIAGFMGAEDTTKGLEQQPQSRRLEATALLTSATARNRVWCSSQSSAIRWKWARPQKREGAPQKQKAPRNHTPCAAQEETSGSSTKAELKNSLRTVLCPPDTAAFSDEEDAASSSQTSPHERHFAGWCSKRRARQPATTRLYLAKARLCLTNLDHRRRMRRRSQRKPTTSQGHLRLFMLHSHRRRTMNSRRIRSRIYPITYDYALRDNNTREARKEEVAKSACTGSRASPPDPKSIQGLRTEGSVWVWRGPKSTGTGEESAKKGLVSGWISWLAYLASIKALILSKEACAEAAKLA